MKYNLKEFNKKLNKIIKYFLKRGNVLNKFEYLNDIFKIVERK